jgi:Arc/MetJ-type ribon-helix-helix transcriptional regulator
MNIKIPDSLRPFLEAQVDSGRYPNADSFVAELLRIEAKVLEGVRAGEPLPSDQQTSRRLEALLDEALAHEGRDEVKVTSAVFDEMEREAQALAEARKKGSSDPLA